MPSIGDLGFVNNRRAPVAPNRTEPMAMPITDNIPQSAINQYIQENSIGFDKLTLSKLYVNQDMESSNFVTGSTGWYIGGDGSAEFNNVTIRGTLIAGEIHIPDEDTTANSFHVEPDGDTFWGCTQSDFDADNDNAIAYILKTGFAKFQNVVVNGTTLNLESVFGDGSDGDLTTSGNVSLSRDMFYDDLTVSAGDTINPSGYRIFVKGTLTIEATGEILDDGNNGSNGSAGGNGAAYPTSATGGAGGAGATGLADGSMYGGSNGGAGSAGGNGPSYSKGSGSTSATNGTAGVQGETANKALGGAAVAGGAGGQRVGGFVAGGLLGAGGGAGGTTTVYNTPKNMSSAYLLIDGLPSVDILRSCPGSGGGGGGGTGGCSDNDIDGDSSSGGAGGGGGGAGSTGRIIAIFARTIVNNGTIQTNGGDGGDGGAGGNGYVSNGSMDGAGYGGSGGGGGAGGNGGVIILVYGTLSGSGATNVSGGTGGSGGAAGTTNVGSAWGGTTDNGNVGSNGNDGNDGEVITLQV